MENKNIRKITIACFAVLAVWDIIDLFDYFSFLMLLAVISGILVVVALLTKNTVLSAVGFGLFVLQDTISILMNMEAIFEGWVLFLILLLWILNLAWDVLLLLVSIKPKSAKSLGTIAAGIATVRLVMVIIYNIIEGYEFSMESFIWGILLIASAMLLGLTYEGLSKNTSVIKASAPIRGVSVAQKTFQTDNIENLLRLKSFLDEGVITQEEFDAKKKQLLGL